MDSTQTPWLPIELVELVIAVAIRQHPFIFRPDKPAETAHLISLLNAVGPLSCGVLIPTKAALMTMWWVNLDFASTHCPIAILDLMLSMRADRPLDYSDRGFFNALLACRPDVVDWWYSHWSRAGGPLFFSDVLQEHAAVGFGQASPNADGPTKLYRLFCKRCIGIDPDNLDLSEQLSDDQVDLLGMHIHHIVDGAHTEILDLVGRILRWGGSSHGVPQLSIESLAWRVSAFKGRLDLLEWLLVYADEPSKEECAECLLPGAFGSGQLSVVEWCIQLCHKLGHEPDIALCFAAATDHGHVHLLQYTIDRLLQPSDCMQHLVRLRRAAAAGHVAVLEWWLAHRDKFGIILDDSLVLSSASEAGQLYVLQWWKDNRLPIAPDDAKRAVVDAAKSGHIDVLEFWLTCDKRLFESFDVNRPLHLASRMGRVSVLEWWKAKELNMKTAFEHHTVDAASRKNHVAVLDWWLNESGVSPLPCTASAFRAAVDEISLDTAEWWLEHIELEYQVDGRWHTTRTAVWAMKYGLCEQWSDLSRGTSVCVLGLLQKSGVTLFSNSSSPNQYRLLMWGLARPCVLDWCARQPHFDIQVFLSHFFDALDGFVYEEWMPGLEWWEASGHPISLSGKAVDRIYTMSVDHPVRQWFGRIQDRLWG